MTIFEKYIMTIDIGNCSNKGIGGIIQISEQGIGNVPLHASCGPYQCSCSSPCLAPAPSRRNMSTWLWICPAHTADCTSGVLHRSPGSDRFYYCHWAPSREGRSTRFPNPEPQNSCDCSLHSPESTNLIIHRVSHRVRGHGIMQYHETPVHTVYKG